jgi:hypothetical protein
MMSPSDVPSPYPGPRFVGGWSIGCVITTPSTRMGLTSGCPLPSPPDHPTTPSPPVPPKTSPFEDKNSSFGEGLSTTRDLGPHTTVKNPPIPPMFAHKQTPVGPPVSPGVIASHISKGLNVPYKTADGNTCVSTARASTFHPNATKNNPSPIRPHKLSVYLREYDQSLSTYLVESFLYGVRIHCVVPPSSYVPSNHTSSIRKLPKNSKMVVSPAHSCVHRWTTSSVLLSA